MTGIRASVTTFGGTKENLKASAESETYEHTLKMAAVQYLKFPVDRRMAEAHLGVLTRSELLRDLADPV